MRTYLLILWRILSFPFYALFWLLSIKELKEALFTKGDRDTPLPDVVSKVFENPGATLEHLDALRKHLFRALVALAITTGASLAYNQYILAFLAAPLEGGLQSLVAIEVTEPIGTVMRVALLSGFILAFPYLAYQIWLFIAPGVISRKNRLLSLIAIPVASMFFVSGVAFAYYVMLPTALPFLLNFMGMTTIPRPSSYVRFTTGLLFWLGMAFEFPLVIYLIAKLGWVKPKILLEQWRLAIVIIAFLAALITPTIDPVNMSLVMGPLIVLYFISIAFAYIAARKPKSQPA